MSDTNTTPTLRSASGWLDRLLLLTESPVAVIGAVLIIFWMVVAIFAPILSPYDPNKNFMDDYGNFGLSTSHLLGRDIQGRDILSRIIWGSRVVITIAPLATLCSYIVGVTAGLVAGYFRGWPDAIIVRISDVILSFPVIILYLIVIAQFGPSAVNVVLAVTLTASPQITRIVRGLTLELRSMEYVQAAKMRGESSFYIMLFEVLPNMRTPVVVDACVRVGYTTIAIGVLGFLGLGLPPPNPDWGGMVKDSYGLMLSFPHMSIFPCIAISTLVVGFNLLADGLREISIKE